MPGLPLRCVVGRGHKYVILAHKHTSLGVLSTIFGFPAEFRSRKRETGMIQPTPLAKTQKKTQNRACFATSDLAATENPQKIP